MKVSRSGNDRSAALAVARASPSLGARRIGTAATADKRLTVAIVTDIGSLNDRSFNQLANKGRLARRRRARHRRRASIEIEDGGGLTSRTSLRPRRRAATTSSSRTASCCGAARTRSRRSSRTRSSRSSTIDCALARRASRPNAAGMHVRRAGGRLPRRLPRGLDGEDEGWQAGHQRRRRATRSRRSSASSRGYSQGAKKANPKIKVLDQLRERPDLQRPGEVQGDRARPDRSRARRSIFQVAGGCGLGALDAAKQKKASGASASTPTSLPRPAHADERAEARRRCGLQRPAKRR